MKRSRKLKIKVIKKNHTKKKESVRRKQKRFMIRMILEVEMVC